MQEGKRVESVRRGNIYRHSVVRARQEIFDIGYGLQE